MECQINIYDSEEKFREYLINNSKKINQLFVFQDDLDGLIYFYCFFSDRTYIATKEDLENNFSYFVQIYLELADDFNLIVCENFNQNQALKIISFN